MTWRVARSLDQLLAQLNALAPNRSRASDGSIGDAAHQAEGSTSDHNPWYGPGIVTARDFTHDPAGGLDCDELAAWLLAAKDPRIKYMIWRGRICDSRAQFNPWTWQSSSGHFQHLHLSVMPNASADDTRPWALGTSEDDVSADDVLYNKPIVGPDGKSIGNLNVVQYWTNAYANRIPTIESKLDALAAALAATAKNANITPEFMRKTVDDSVKANSAEQAKLVAAQTVTELRAAVRDEMGSDNEAQADAIVDAVARRLAGPQ